MASASAFPGRDLFRPFAPTVCQTRQLDYLPSPQRTLFSELASTVRPTHTAAEREWMLAVSLRKHLHANPRGVGPGKGMGRERRGVPGGGHVKARRMTDAGPQPGGHCPRGQGCLPLRDTQSRRAAGTRPAPSHAHTCERTLVRRPSAPTEPHAL